MECLFAIIFLVISQAGIWYTVNITEKVNPNKIISILANIEQVRVISTWLDMVSFVDEYKKKFKELALKKSYVDYSICFFTHSENGNVLVKTTANTLAYVFNLNKVPMSP